MPSLDVLFMPLPRGTSSTDARCSLMGLAAGGDTLPTRCSLVASSEETKNRKKKLIEEV